MGFLGFYLIALIPAAIGFVLWLFSHKFALWEWAATTVIALATAGIIHALTIHGMTADEEVWSGQVTSVHYRPEWRERYEEAVYRTETYTTTDSKGNTQTHTREVFSHYETRYTTHPDVWTVHANILDREVDQGTYERIRRELGGQTTSTPGTRRTGKMSSTMVGGDPNDYVTQNTANATIPVAKNVAFENRVKASPSVFSYRTLSPEESAKIYDYPYVSDTFQSGRNLSGSLSTRKWDELNARLGPSKHVNLIIVRLPTPQAARDLEAKWVGGKKNDLVLTFGANASGSAWSYVFGWTEKAIAKRNLESLLLYHYPIDDAIIPEIERVVRKDYQMVDWHKFDYLDLQPKTSHYVWLIVTMILTQGGAMAWALFNGIDKGHEAYSSRWYRLTWKERLINSLTKH